MFQSRNDRLRRLEARAQEKLQLKQSEPDAQIELLTRIIAAEQASMTAVRRACPGVNQDKTKRNNEARILELKALCEQTGEDWAARCERVKELLAKYNRTAGNTR